MKTAAEKGIQQDGQPVRQEFRPPVWRQTGQTDRTGRQWLAGLGAGLALALGLTLAWPGMAATAPAVANQAANPTPVKHVLVFGDSLSAGYGMAREDAWPTLLGQRLQAGPATRNWQVVNASVSGETTHGGLTRLAATLARERPAVVVLELGGNDALRGLPLPDTRRNLSTMVRQARASGARVLLVGIALPPNFGEDYTRDFAAMYAAVARDTHVPLLANLVEALGVGREDFQADGIHPQGRVQGRLLDSVMKQLGPLLKP